MCRLYGFTPRNIKVFREFIRNGGDRIKAIMDSSNKEHTSLRSVKNNAKELFGTPQARAMIQVMMGEENTQKAIQTTVEGMEATTLKTNKGLECPDWPARLRASETILKIMGAFDKPPYHRDNKGNVIDAEVVEVDWTSTHPEIVKFFARFGKWPKKEVEQKLIAGETTTEEISGNSGE
jgi:hypothetical protein